MTGKLDEETEWVTPGEVGDPMTEEEAEQAYEALWALHLPPATDEEVAEAQRLADLAERHRQIVAEAIHRKRAQDWRVREVLDEPREDDEP